jgi:hypothetical protein
MRKVLRRAVDATEAAAFLRPQQLRQTEELAQLLGCSLPEDDAVWQALPDAAAGLAFSGAARASDGRWLALAGAGV